MTPEWDFLLQLFKLAHLYQVEVALDACTRRFKHILERKDHVASRTARQSHANRASVSGGGRDQSDESSEEEEERTKQTCYALELLAFLLHVQEAETRDMLTIACMKPPGQAVNEAGMRHGSRCGARAEESAVKETEEAKRETSMNEDEAAANGLERREEVLLRMLDAYLYPQLAAIVHQIRCEDVLTLQHLLRLSVCRSSPSSPRSVSLPLSLSWASIRTTQPMNKYNT